MKNLKSIFLYVSIGIGGILIGALIFGGSQPQSIEDHIAEVHTNEAGEVIYSCSMHPHIRQNEPGNCPICGMELIPVDDAASASDPNDLVMTEAAMKLAEIETTPVIKQSAVSEIRLPGKVEINQNKKSAITSHVSGRIVELFVDFEGDYVQEGQKIASIYSPELITAQQELMETAKYKDQNPILYEAARKKLELWELPSLTIDDIEGGEMLIESVDVVSPVSGFIERIHVQRQQHVMAGFLMYEVTDLASVWVMFDIFESDISAIRAGQQIEYTTTSYPGRTFSGLVDYIDPTLENATRTLKIRVEAENVQNLLKPNMLVEGIVLSEKGEESLLIPRSSVLWTGTRSIVFIKKNGTVEPTFTAREIELGERVGDQFIVVSGLSEGEEVVMNGTFKLDSAAQLADKLSMMNRTPGTGANRTGHEGHIMQEPTENNETKVSKIVDHSSHQSEEESIIPAEFHDQLKNVVTEYLSLSDALNQSNATEAAQSAENVLQAIDNTNMNLLDGEDHIEWMRFLSSLNNEAESISNSNSIEDQRASFVSLSTKLIETVKHFEVPGVYYQQFCPMSNNGEGAYWLSDSEEIANPYYGEMMHNCGETITKIEF